MKINEWNSMMKWLTRKKPSPKERADVLQWIDYNNGMYGTEAQHKEYKKKYATVANKYDESEDPRYIEPKEMDAIKKELQVSPMVKKPKKQIIKKTLIVEKPKPTKPLVIDYLELQDWLNEVDPNWTDEKPNEKVLLQVPRRELKGLASILKVG